MILGLLEPLLMGKNKEYKMCYSGIFAHTKMYWNTVVQHKTEII